MVADLIFLVLPASYTFADGSHFEGTWKNFLPHGHGTYTWPDGTVFKGSFNEGQIHGEGELSQQPVGNLLYNERGPIPTKITYTGGFSNGCAGGKGIITFSLDEARTVRENTCTQFSGHFSKGAATGAASASAAARSNASSRSSAIGAATINQPVVGTYEAIDTDSAIETDARNGGQQLSKEARSGVQLILPGTGVNSGDKKAARAESAVDANANNRFLIKQERTASPETYAAVDDVFAKVDANGDNELSPEERINASNKVQLSAIYKLADTNRDGMVSRAELTVAMEANAGR